MPTKDQLWFIPTQWLYDRSGEFDMLDCKDMPVNTREDIEAIDFVAHVFDNSDGARALVWVPDGKLGMLQLRFENAEPISLGHAHVTQVNTLPEPDDLPYVEYVVPLQQVQAYRFDKDHYNYILDPPTTKSKPMPLGLSVEYNRDTKECAFYCTTVIGQVPVYTGDLILQHPDSSVSVLRKHQLEALVLLQRA